MYIEISADDPNAIHKAIAEAIPGMTSEEVILATIQRGRETGLYHLSLSSSKGGDKAPDAATSTS